jgi:hypothetical protein
VSSGTPNERRREVHTSFRVKADDIDGKKKSAFP